MDNRQFRNLLLRKSYNFFLGVVKLCLNLRKNKLLIPIADQLLRSAASIGANIAEAQGSASKREFKNFIHHAFKSCWETRYWLSLINDAELVSDKKLEGLIS